MKMSDALRGAAETAPVEGISISTGAVRSRARRNRAVRSGANGIVGVGAAVLVFAGVMGVVNGQTGLSTAGAEADREDSAASGASDGAIEPGYVGSGIGGGVCGTEFDVTQFATGDVAAAATLGELTDDALPVALDFTGVAIDSFAIEATTYYVLWDGIVVATYDGSGKETSAADVPLANCWDGAALPAGDYSLVAVSPVTQVVPAAPPVEEPTGEEPDGASSPAVENPDASVSHDADEDIAEAPTTYAVTDAVPFTVPGDAVDNPFDEYLNGPQPLDPTTPTTPSDALTSDAARKAYNDALAGAWDMAPGTQRVVKTGDSADPNDEDLWNTGYFGCAMEGTADAFPSNSAQLDWLSVSATVPAAIHVSYGWVVDDNPLVHYSVTNTSEWSMPGFYEGSTPRLVLVKDGRVVAEAYPVNPDLNYGVSAYATDGEKAAASSAMIWAPDNGYLAPGSTLSGDYLWRDVSGCWIDNDTAKVRPGPYTLLSAHEIYLGGVYAVEGDAAALERDAAEGEATAYGEDDVSPIVAPAPDDSDYVSFTVWTSIGTVSVQS